MHPPSDLREIIINEKNLETKASSFFVPAEEFICILCTVTKLPTLHTKTSEPLAKPVGVSNPLELVDELDEIPSLTLDELPRVKVGNKALCI